jgi:thioester reductase-like protein
MRVVITGITGLVGARLAGYLLTRGRVDVIGFTRWRSDDRSLRHLRGQARLHAEHAER